MTDMPCRNVFDLLRRMGFQSCEGKTSGREQSPDLGFVNEELKAKLFVELPPGDEKERYRQIFGSEAIGRPITFVYGETFSQLTDQSGLFNLESIMRGRERIRSVLVDVSKRIGSQGRIAHVYAEP